MGKKAISQLTFFHYIVGITIGSIAATLSTDVTLKPFPQWVGLDIWVGLALLFEWIHTKMSSSRSLISVTIPDLI